MRIPSRETVEMVRANYPIGTRVELVSMDDVQAPPIGTRGTVKGVDDTASLLVAWDNGSSLNVIYGVDVVKKYEKVNNIDNLISKAEQTCEDVNKSGNELYVRLVSADICDFLEEILDEHDLTIPSDDREGIEGEARLYGEVYSNLESNVTDVLATLCGMVKGNPDILINANEIDELKPVSVDNELYVRAFAIKICDLFNDLLDEYDITIPSEDREGNEEEARIYGDVYFGLEDGITETLAVLCEKVKTAPDVVINIEDYNGFVDEDVQKQTGVDGVLAGATAKSGATNKNQIINIEKDVDYEK